jgi:hypothetical protein
VLLVTRLAAQHAVTGMAAVAPPLHLVLHLTS